MSKQINPYLDLPLPIGVKIDFGFKMPPLESKIEESLEKKEVVREVNRAVNRVAYEEGIL